MARPGAKDSATKVPPLISVATERALIKDCFEETLNVRAISCLLVVGDRGLGATPEKLQLRHVVEHGTERGPEFVEQPTQFEPIALPPGIAFVRPPAGGPLDIRYLSVNLDAGTSDHRDHGSAV